MGIKSRVDGQEMLLLGGAEEGPDLSGQTAKTGSQEAKQSFYSEGGRSDVTLQVHGPKKSLE